MILLVNGYSLWNKNNCRALIAAKSREGRRLGGDRKQKQFINKKTKAYFLFY